MTQKRSGPHTAEGGSDPAETAAYIADLTKELADLARQSRLEIVAYLLNIVELEAKGRIQPNDAGTTGRHGS